MFQYKFMFYSAEILSQVGGGHAYRDIKDTKHGYKKFKSTLNVTGSLN